MIFSKRKKLEKRLKEAFGKIKDDSFDYTNIESYFRKSHHKDCLQVVDDRTCNDLDFDELFSFIDRTTSKVGQQYLYKTLREIPKDSTRQNYREALINKVSESIDFRLFIQSNLIKLANKNDFYIASLFQDEYKKPSKYFWIFHTLHYLSILFVILSFIHPVAILPFAIVCVLNLIIHYWNKKNLYQYVYSIPSSIKLYQVAKIFWENNELKQLNPQLSKSLKVFEKLKRKMSIFSFDTHMQGDLYVVVWTLIEFIKIIFLLEPIYSHKLLRELDNKRKDLESIYDFVGEIDAIVSVASLRFGLTDYCIPNLEQNIISINIEDIYHPLISNCIVNDIYVNGNSVLLTGSNMSGKTSFIKMIALNTITAQTINTCFAKTYEMPKMRVFSAIRISDDLMNDKSYYLDEVLTIKKMISESTSESFNLFILDEIFKGTNTVERIAAGKSVLSYICHNNNLVFVSTHDIELTELLDTEYDLYHFSENIDHNKIDFDYKLKKGKLKKKNAIRILELNQYPESIIKEAIDISEKIN